MKRFVDIVQYLVLAGTAVVLLALFVNEPPTAPEGPEAPAAVAAGASVYTANCASCHGADGSGGIGPALGGGAVVAAIPDAADQVVVITEGRTGMPSFDGRLTPEEIQAVTDYTRNDL